MLVIDYDLYFFVQETWINYIYDDELIETDRLGRVLFKMHGSHTSSSKQSTYNALQLTRFVHASQPARCFHLRSNCALPPCNVISYYFKPSLTRVLNVGLASRIPLTGPKLIMVDARNPSVNRGKCVSISNIYVWTLSLNRHDGTVNTGAL